MNLKIFKAQPVSMIHQGEDSIVHGNKCLKEFIQFNTHFQFIYLKRECVVYETIIEQKHTEVTASSSEGRGGNWLLLNLDLQKDGHISGYGCQS